MSGGNREWDGVMPERMMPAMMLVYVYQIEKIIGRKVTFEDIDKGASILNGPISSLRSENDIVVTPDKYGRVISVTRRNEDGEILSVIWGASEADIAPTPQAHQPEIDALKAEVMGRDVVITELAIERAELLHENAALKAEISRLKSALMRDAISDIQNVERVEVFPVYTQDDKLRKGAEKALIWLEQPEFVTQQSRSDVAKNLRKALEEK